MSSIDTTVATCIGARDGGGNGQLNGNICHVGIWDAELTSAHATEIYNKAKPGDLLQHSAVANLVGYYKIDGDTHATATDSSTNSNDGTYTNTEAADIEYDAPGIAISVNMEEADREQDTP